MKPKIFLICMVATLLLSACGMSESAVETVVAEKVFTAVAQTVEALPTQTPLPTATELPSSTPTSTETSSPSPTISPTSSPTQTPNPGGSITQANICDNAGFDSDITIPDGTRFAPGAAFAKIWRIRNTGTCTWDSEYTIAFTVGDSMNGVSPQKITDKTVAPGETIDISVDMIAPSKIGSYTGYWRLQNASKDVFGQSFYVQIDVVNGISTITATPTLTATGGAVSTATSTTAPTETATETPSETPEDTPVP